MRQDVEATLTHDECDLCIRTTIPSGFLGDHLISIELLAVAAATHPLHRLGRTLTRDDLAREVVIALEDAAHKSAASRSWLISHHHWTMNTVESAINAVCRGMGFAWLPRHRIDDALHSGELKPLRLKTGRIRTVNLYLVPANPRLAGPATQSLGEAILAACRS
jgi:DNA-binding transcriptional LysR family regulator